MRNNARSIKTYSLPFSAWELRLYLDTHPMDTKALEAYKQLCAAAGSCNYACAVNMKSDGSDGCGCESGGEARWSWIDDPWPWEASANIVESED